MSSIWFHILWTLGISICVCMFRHRDAILRFEIISIVDIVAERRQNHGKYQMIFFIKLLNIFHS